jgi:hypothetical protein
MTYKYVHGAETELRRLEEFPAKVEANVARGAVRAAAKVMHGLILGLTPIRSGKLASTVRLSTRKDGKIVKGAAKVGNRARGIYWGGFVMGGTKPHLIKPSVKSALNIGGVLRRVVRHPGTKAQPFVEQADRAGRERAIRAAFEYADGRVRQLVAEQGNL